jgi:small subunit ribosomal protein S19e
VYIHGPLSVEDLRSKYGGSKQRGYNLAHHVDASGGIIRIGLKQLESSGYVVKKNNGRIVSDDGMKRVDRIATELHKELQKTNPELSRYS